MDELTKHEFFVKLRRFHVVFSTKNRELRIAAALISMSAIYGEQDPSAAPPGLKYFFVTAPVARATG